MRTPRVLEVDERYLALEWVEPGHGGLDAMGSEELGRDLAIVHMAGAPCFGWDAGEGCEAVERVCGRQAELYGPAEPPSRLHGDLWSGNVMSDREGRPWLIDPAAYGGHREVDLAMLRLFGAPSPRVFAAYEEVAPLAAGWRDRVELYQLLPLLVHTLLFGGSYAAAAERAARRYVG